MVIMVAVSYTIRETQGMDMLAALAALGTALQVLKVVGWLVVIGWLVVRCLRLQDEKRLLELRVQCGQLCTVSLLNDAFRFEDGGNSVSVEHAACGDKSVQRYVLRDHNKHDYIMLEFTPYYVTMCSTTVQSPAGKVYRE